MRMQQGRASGISPMRTSLLRLVAILSVGMYGCQAAHAGYSVFMTPVGSPAIPPSTIDTGLIDPSINDVWVSYVLGVSSDDGSRIGAVDVDLRGMFHQRWNWDGDAQEYGQSASGFNVAGFDSHLMPPQNALFPLAPSEDNNIFMSLPSLPDVSGSIDYGVGSQMKGVWGIPGATATSLDLAYVVIPRGSESQLEYAVDVANPSGDMFHFRQGASFPPVPPHEYVPLPAPDPSPPPVIVPAPPAANQPSPTPSPPLAAAFVPELYASATQLLWTSDNGLPTGFKAYQLSVSTLDASVFGAVDVRVNAPLHQIWTDQDGDGVADPSPRGLATSGADSHLMIPDGALTMPLSEDNGVASIPLDDGMGAVGMGSQLGGAWGLTRELQSDVAQLAYLVVPESTSLRDLDIKIDLVAWKGDTLSPVISLAAENFNVVGSDGSAIEAALPIQLPPDALPPISDPSSVDDSPTASPNSPDPTSPPAFPVDPPSTAPAPPSEADIVPDGDDQALPDEATIVTIMPHVLPIDSGLIYRIPWYQELRGGIELTLPNDSELLPVGGVEYLDGAFGYDTSAAGNIEVFTTAKSLRNALAQRDWSLTLAAFLNSAAAVNASSAPEPSTFVFVVSAMGLIGLARRQQQPR